MRLDKLRKITLLFSVFLSVISASAQTGIDSPYSRFGIGNISSSSPNARQQAMGGIGNALTTSRFVNPSNPATYSGFDSLSFLFNAGFSASAVTYTTTKQTEKGNSAGLAYFSTGFPIMSWWRMAIGLTPASRIGFNVIVPGVSEQNIAYNKSYEGNGGLNRLYFGNSFRISKNLSAGINVNYLFGKSTTSSFLYFPDSGYMATTKVESRLLANDISVDYGLLYTLKLTDQERLHLGATFGQKMNLGVTREYLIQSQFGGLNGSIEQALDTILYNPSQKGTLVLPPKAGLGLVYEKSNQWLAGIDFNWQNWEKYQLFNQSDSLINSWNIAAGGQFTPNNTSISGYWKRVTYRAGARYNQTYLKINGKPINEFGISFGMGLPLPRSLTTVDLSIELGQRGTMNENLIRETFVNFTLGISIYERWFVKSRYN